MICHLVRFHHVRQQLHLPQREMLFNEMGSLRKEHDSLLLEVKVLKSHGFPLDAVFSQRRQ